VRASDTGCLIQYRPRHFFGGGHAETRGVPACLPRHPSIASFTASHKLICAQNFTAKQQQQQNIKKSKMSCKHVDAAGRSNHLPRRSPLLPYRIDRGVFFKRKGRGKTECLPFLFGLGFLGLPGAYSMGRDRSDPLVFKRRKLIS